MYSLQIRRMYQRVVKRPVENNAPWGMATFLGWYSKSHNGRAGGALIDNASSSAVCVRQGFRQYEQACWFRGHRIHMRSRFLRQWQTKKPTGNNCKRPLICPTIIFNLENLNVFLSAAVSSLVIGGKPNPARPRTKWGKLCTRTCTARLNLAPRATP